MKYVKTYEAVNNERLEDIVYLSKSQGTGIISYIEEVINHYKINDEQIHNLKLAVEYSYLSREDFGNVVSQIINSGDVWLYRDSEKKFIKAYEKNFKTKIIEIEKPYPICYVTWNKYKWDITQNNELNSYIFDDIIGEISAEYPFDKKYVIGKGRYRSKGNNKTLWEEYRNTKRESEFIQVRDEKNLYILTKTDIDNIKIVKDTKKYNI